MILALDIGNSFVKWKIAEANGSSVLEGSFSLSNILNSLEELAVYPIQQLVYSSVTHDDVLGCIKNTSLADISCYEVKVERSAFGVMNGYEEYNLLGVDRWIVIVEAYVRSKGKPICVVDVGTAITLDVVDEKGFHQGGFIVPSAYLMKQSLECSTSKVRADGGPCVSGYGKTTSCAVKNGVSRLIGAWIEREITGFRQKYSGGVVYITGGGAGDICDAGDKYVLQETSLLLDGLIRFAGARKDIICVG